MTALARQPSAVETAACPLASTKVFIAATAGSSAFVEPLLNFPRLMATGAVGLSLSNSSLDQVVNPPATENAAVRGDAAVDSLLRAWQPGRALALGAFYSQQFTPDVATSHYSHPKGTATETTLTRRLLDAGFRPDLVELDLSLSTLPSTADQPMPDKRLADVKLAVNDLRKTISPKVIMLWLSPNDGIFGDFGTSPVFANEREAILYAGGLAFDTPANYWFAVGAGYQNTVISQLRWAKSHGVLTMFAVSPFARGTPGTAQFNFDPHFLEATQAIYAQLASHDALPNFWMAANYSPGEASGNRPWTEARAESVSQVALWLAEHAHTEPAGPTACLGPSPH